MRIGSVVGVFLMAATLSANSQEINREVAVTFDDLPTVNLADSSLGYRIAATHRLLRAFKERDIPVTGFVNEVQLYEDGELQDERVGLLRQWLDAGMNLGNHSYSHPDLHRVSLEAFTADVLQGEKITRRLLEEHGGALTYFRHPYLHTGTDLETRRNFETFLSEHGYRVAPVSIDNSEWIFARAYMIARQASDEPLAARIGADYVDYMLEMFTFYEDQSRQLFDRNIAHVLLLHANELNADWFGALADRLAAIGYHFIGLDQALQDPAYASEDTYTGPGGITWIHRWAITQQLDPAMFRGEPATPGYVLELSELPEHGY